MKLYLICEDVVICVDLIVLEGYGEIIGGLECVIDYDYLKEKVVEFGLLEEEYSWYLDLCKYGFVLYFGFGLGLECVVMFIIGNEYICEVILFLCMLNCIYL